MTEPNLFYARRGGNYSQDRADLQIGSPSNTLSTGNAVTLVWDGIQTPLTAQTNVAPDALPQQADLTDCLYVFCVTPGGAVSQTKGEEKSTAAVKVGAEALEWPRPTEGSIPIGGYRVITNGATFTNGTTDFDAAGVTTVFYNFAGRVPAKLF